VSFVRVAGLAALAGGILRLINIVTTSLPQGTLAALYFITDALLLTGVAGLWISRRAAMGVVGTLGLSIFAVGILVIRASAFGIGSYPLGAVMALVGLAIYSLGALVRRYTAMWAPICWLTALPPAITAGLLPPGGLLIGLSAALFGAGFILAGLELLRESRTVLARA
jgi:hypothetical protein